MKSLNLVSKLFIISILFSMMSCSPKMNITAFQNGEYFKVEKNEYKKSNIPWIKFYLEEKIGFQDVNLELSESYAYCNASETFVITDIEGQKHTITKDKYGLDITMMMISYVKNGKTQKLKTIVITKDDERSFHIATEINGIRIS